MGRIILERTEHEQKELSNGPEEETQPLVGFELLVKIKDEYEYGTELRIRKSPHLLPQGCCKAAARLPQGWRKAGARLTQG